MGKIKNYDLVDSGLMQRMNQEDVIPSRKWSILLRIGFWGVLFSVCVFVGFFMVRVILGKYL